ncbi:phage tail protein I [Parasalinivibrio latis]|uniref:phage tail protein I n=1 Tax=Parasalinivibrio latis TaxID=2952610 RepID=UPI0030DF30D5
MADSILPPNATNEERALEQSVCRSSDIPVPLHDLWNPETCPEELLPWLAWAFSVEEWDSSWTAGQKREVIKQSATLHLKKGTVGAVKRALNALGVKVDITEWFETGGEPHTFKLVSWANANLAPNDEAVLGPALYDSLARLIDSVKPVRSHYEIRIGVAFNDGLGINNIMNAGQSLRREVEPKQEPMESRCGLNTAALIQTTEVVRKQMLPMAATDFKNTSLAVAAVSSSVVLVQFFMEAT